MKKIYILAVAAIALLAAPQQANAQAFLNKMKEKAQQAAEKAAGKMLEGTKMGELIAPASTPATSAEADDSHDADEETSVFDTNRKATKLQRQTVHVGNWDDALVTPSTAKFPIPLMNELPAIPAASELANPTEAGQKAYYMAIQKVSLRAQALSDDETCSQEDTELFFNQYKQKMMKAYGLTEREFAIYAGEVECSEEEAAKVMQKVLGFDPEALMAAFGDIDNMSDAEREAQAKALAGDMLGSSTNAAAKVFSKYPNEIKKYTGKTAAETSQLMQQTTQLAMQGKEKEADALSKKFESEVKAYQKTLSAADQKEAKAFEAKMQKELQEAMQSAARNASPLGGLMAGMQEAQKKAAEVEELKKKQDNYYEALAKVFTAASCDGSSDIAFAEADRKKVEALKAQIMATDDPKVYNPLYAQANEIISSYRLRAAQSWRADVEKRFNSIKNSMADIIKLNRQAIEDKIIPECMLYRAPLNMVIMTCETLESAYTEVPNNYPVLYQEEVVRQVPLKEGEYLMWPEFFVSNSLDNVLAGKTLFKHTADGHNYQFNAGKWVNVDNVKPTDKTLAGEQKATSMKWTSSDNKRTVTFVEEGAYFLLPEGDAIEPNAIEKRGNNLVWAEIRQITDQQGNTTAIQVVKCTYKL